MDKKVTLKGKKIPKFKSYDEEANFWDIHSPLDYGTWKEVKLEVTRPLEHILGVRLDAKTIDQICLLSNDMGIGPSTLVRMWIVEKLGSTSKYKRSTKSASARAILHQIRKP